MGLKDSFRDRHADKVAFTYIGKSGGSRLDQLWTRPATGTILQIAKAPIIWKWQYTTDHTPILADISFAIALISETNNVHKTAEVACSEPQGDG